MCIHRLIETLNPIAYVSVRSFRYSQGMVFRCRYHFNPQGPNAAMAPAGAFATKFLYRSVRYRNRYLQSTASFLEKMFFANMALLRRPRSSRPRLEAVKSQTRYLHMHPTRCSPKLSVRGLQQPPFQSQPRAFATTADQESVPYGRVPKLEDILTMRGSPHAIAVQYPD